MKKLFMAILNFFRSIFKKRQVISEPEVARSQILKPVKRILHPWEKRKRLLRRKAARMERRRQRIQCRVMRERA